MPKENPTDAPLISVIIPAYNADRFIGEAISSAQTQTYPNVEIVVVDDGSTDRTHLLVEQIADEDSRVRLVRQSNQGVAAARNRAIAESEGAYIAPLDADDFWFPQKLELQQRHLAEAGPSAGLAYSWWMYVNNDSEIYRLAGRPTLEGDVRVAHLIQNFIGNASVPLFRRSVLERVGGYDASLREQEAEGCEDWDLTLRVAAHYSFCVVPKHLSAYRWERRARVKGEGNSMSDNTASMARSYRVTFDRARQRHPNFPERVFRYSAANFHHYLATKAYENGHYANALRWLIQMVRNDRVALLSLWVWGTMLKSMVWIAVVPISSRMEVDPERWENLKQWIRMPYNKLRDLRLKQSSDILKPGELDNTRSQTQGVPIGPSTRRRRNFQGLLQAAEGQDVGR